MFELILEKLGSLGGLFLPMVGEAFLSKIGEQMADNVRDKGKSIKDFEPILKDLQKKLNALNAKASDVEQQIKNVELSGRKKRKREVEEWLGEVKSFEKEVDELVESKRFIVRFIDGGKATQLSERVEKLVKQSQNFGELVVDGCGARGETLLADGMLGEAFNENLETILKHLESRQVSSIGVHGVGGVGKTALAKHIHNQLMREEYVGRVLWVTVSREFTIKSLQDKIARLLGVTLLDEEEEDMRSARLHRALSQQKNLVLILDDVCENIDLLKVGCRVSVECCRLIITTRSEQVCHRVRCQKLVRVEPLGEEEAWKLFNETLGNDIQLSSEAKEIAKSVAELCGGLPLRIMSMAESMRGVTSIHMWRNALAEAKECVVGEDGIGELDEV